MRKRRLLLWLALLARVGLSGGLLVLLAHPTLGKWIANIVIFRIFRVTVALTHVPAWPWGATLAGRPRETCCRRPPASAFRRTLRWLKSRRGQGLTGLAIRASRS
jgi:hypothetical protein